MTHSRATLPIIRRTFEAKRFPVGSSERDKFNLNAETSEFYTSQPYMFRLGTVAYSYRTKREAERAYVAKRLEYLRCEIEAERIGYGEIAELQALAEFIDPDDTLLQEWAGVLDDMYHTIERGTP